ncbi:MAG TPA: hypothetical protein VKF38_07515 [Anaerolineaceae bacterium]|nr:hypothetical protein [Anaerolineaceae bacterium]
MRLNRRLIITAGYITIIICLLLLLGRQVVPARADDTIPTPTPTSPTPARQANLFIDYTVYEWWLLSWQTNQAMCQIFIEHPGLPTNDEIYTFCGGDLFNQWISTKPCAESDMGKDSSQCDGMYLHAVAKTPGKRKMVVNLPVPEVWVSLTDCNPVPPDNRCSSIPGLILTGEEPLPNEAIIRLQGIIGSETFSCPGDQCVIPLQPTGNQGQSISFWADSSYGDESEHFTALVRVMPWGDFMDPEKGNNEQPQWYVDVLSSQWRGEKPASCADVWQVFPNIGGPPTWLTTPKKVENLKSQVSYNYLTKALIQNGVVEVNNCGNGGGSDNQCGVKGALASVIDWQNRFDNEIMKVAAQTGVPAQLMKNVFARESQLWPGIYTTYKEAGLGQLTENGADTILLWNPDFFSQFCPLVLNKDVCSIGFGNLNADQQSTLRGALVRNVNASCSDCQGGIDLTQANFSVRVFAEGLEANCQQVGRILSNTTLVQPGQTTSYEDLWRFTLVNYNAGAGCLANAIQTTYGNSEPLDWEHVSSHLEPACQGAIDYVNTITMAGSPTPTATPKRVLPTRTPLPLTTEAPGSPTPTSQITVGPSSTPNSNPYPAETLTSTPESNPYPGVEPSSTAVSYP